MTEIKYLITFRGQEDVKQAKDVTVTCNNHMALIFRLFISLHALWFVSKS